MSLTDLLLGSFAIAVLVLAGLTILRWIPAMPWASGWPARLALGHLVGSGAMAWIVTAIAVLSGRLTAWPVYLALLLLSAVTWLLRRRLPASEPTPLNANPAAAAHTRTSTWQIIAICAVAFGISAACLNLVIDQTMTPDAYWNWALKAKAFYLAGSLDPLMTQCCTHPSYPIQFHLQSWWIYKHLRHVADWWPHAEGVLYYLDLVALTFAGCRANMSTPWAWIVTAFVANDIIEVFNVAHGQPDSAVAAYILASSICLVSYFAQRDRGSRLTAVLLLVGALQTKNEGLAWATYVTVCLVVFELKSRTPKRALWPLACLVCAAAPWALFKHTHTMTVGPDEALASLHTIRTEWLLRIRTIVFAHLRNFGPYSLPFLLVLSIPLMVRGWARISKPVLALIAAQFAAYLAVYFIVADQVYQLAFMLRGISQISPALICICMIAYQSSKTPLQSPATVDNTLAATANEALGPAGAPA